MTDSQASDTHLPCPDCGSSDALAQYNDHTYCYSCSTFKWNKNQHTNENVYQMETTLKHKPFRGLTEDTVKRYGVTVSEDNNTHHYPYYNDSGAVVATKIRSVINKTFFSQGEIKDGLLFGQNLFRNKGKYITLCEGEVDAMSAYQMLGSKWPVISIKSGAQSAVKDVKKNFEYLDSFDNIVICFDNDDP